MNDKKMLIDTSVWMKYFKVKLGTLVSWRWKQREGGALTRLTQLTLLRRKPQSLRPWTPSATAYGVRQ